MKSDLMAGLCLCLALGTSGAAQESEEVFYDGRSAKEWAADLKAKDPKTRRAAAEAFYQIRPRPKSVDSILIEALKDEDMTVRIEVANTLADTHQDLALAVY
jgi:HEAT repeat protein